ncbi:hypothetical protein F4821DRAFT_226473 [Hypoxylon rubiginosum]|uniref:Uncharacterized protein n=1 Tax=Hypoxylon rubiginosum TaxID=110542 RepID=A0ACC0DGW5_9PEZI|nr:hypothetical protein F4821DRAFT_226473 [Hypoxylon rubiginosum]
MSHQNPVRRGSEAPTPLFVTLLVTTIGGILHCHSKSDGMLHIRFGNGRNGLKYSKSLVTSTAQSVLIVSVYILGYGQNSTTSHASSSRCKHGYAELLDSKLSREQADQ